MCRTDFDFFFEKKAWYGAVSGNKNLFLRLISTNRRKNTIRNK